MHDHPPIGYADLHVHPSGDAVSSLTPAAVYAALRASGLQVAALADHDRIDVARALAARGRDEGIAIELLVGEEITTRDGHLVGIGLGALVPVGMSFGETVAAIHDQGAIAVVAHPLLPAFVSASERLLRELADGDSRRRPDALEARHPTAAWLPGWRRRVEQLAERYGYAIVGGSDAHRARSVGRARTGFHGATAADLVAAIHARETWTEGGRASLRDIFRRRGPG